MTNHKLRGSINAKGTDITVLSRGMGDDYLCLTDIARYKNPLEPKAVVANWIRLRNTIEYMGIWERLNNPLFKGLEFEAFMREADPKNINALYISKVMPQAERLTDLNRLARTQLKSLLSLDSLRGLPRGGDTDGIA